MAVVAGNIDFPLLEEGMDNLDTMVLEEETEETSKESVSSTVGKDLLSLSLAAVATDLCLFKKATKKAAEHR